MIECRKCKKAETLFIPERHISGSQVTTIYTSSGLIRCDRRGRKYVSRDTKKSCDFYDPKR